MMNANGSNSSDGHNAGLLATRELARNSAQNDADIRRADLLGKPRINYSTASWREILKISMWHGGSVYDAWLTATSAQVGSVILTLPYTLSQMGYGFGISLQFLNGAFGVWTVYLLSWIYAEFLSRRAVAGVEFAERHVVQYHEIIGGIVGSWAGRLVMTINMMYLVFACTLQLIACSSNIYYMDSTWDKSHWLYLFGAIAIPSVLIPTLHNFRIVSLLGILTTSYTSAYMTKAALHQGQVQPVTHRGAQDMVQFFSGATNILFAYGSHGLANLFCNGWLPEKSWRPCGSLRSTSMPMPLQWVIRISSLCQTPYPFTGPFDELLTHSNAFAVLPPSPYKNVAIIAMIVHQLASFMTNIMPLFFFWEKVLGIHTAAKLYWLRSLSRVPVVLLIWFIALAIPFFGPINSMMGAYFISFTVYIVPNVAFLYIYRSTKARQESICPPFLFNWTSMFVISFLMAIWVLVVGFGFGAWASTTIFARQISSFGFFDSCYQCPHK